jgi:hypothetical protein
MNTRAPIAASIPPNAGKKPKPRLAPAPGRHPYGALAARVCTTLVYVAAIGPKIPPFQAE